MVNVRFSSYEDFLNFFRNAPRQVQNILYKAYPDFARRMTDDYLNSIKKVGTTVKGSASKAADAAQKLLGNVEKATENIKGFASKGTTKATGFKPSKLGTAGALWGILDPRTSWNQKVLSGGLAFPATAPYAAAGLGVTAIAPGGINAYYDKKYDMDERYNIPEGQLPNAYNLAPELKELTPEERLKYDKAVLDSSRALRAEGQQVYNEGQKEVAAWNNLINNNFEEQYTQPQVSNTLAPVPTFNSPNAQSVQNAQQGGLSNNQDILIPNNNQQTLMANVAPSNQQFDLPDYKILNIKAENDMDKLQQMVNDSNQQPIMNRGADPAGSEALAKYVQLMEARQNAANQARQQQAAQILQDYQAAVTADRQQNMVNQLANSLEPRVQRAPVSFVLPNGSLATIRRDQYIPPAPLPTNTNTNASNYINALNLQQQTAGNNKQTDYVGQALTSQALAEKYRENPLIFLNPDLAKEYMSGRNTIENTQVTGQERRTDIPIQTQADLITTNMDNYGKALIEQLKGEYDLRVEGYRQQGYNQRQAEQLSYNQSALEYQQKMQNYRLMLEQKADMDRAEYNRGTQYGVANIYANRPSTQQSDPLQEMYKRSQIYTGAAAIQNPQQQQQYWNFVLGNSGIAQPSQYGTTLDQQEILRRARTR